MYLVLPLNHYCGFIPQSPHTYSILTAGYPLVKQHLPHSYFICVWYLCHIYPWHVSLIFILQLPHSLSTVTPQLFNTYFNYTVITPQLANSESNNTLQFLHIYSRYPKCQSDYVINICKSDASGTHGAQQTQSHSLQLGSGRRCRARTIKNA